jgi:uncharacterized protein YggL (DUF469 family)
VFFSRSRKWKKIADAILVEVQHLICRLELQINKKINVVSDDDYLLGFIDELCDLLINRAEQEGVKLDQVAATGERRQVRVRVPHHSASLPTKNTRHNHYGNAHLTSVEIDT